MFRSSYPARTAVALVTGVALTLGVAPQGAIALDSTETDYIIQVPEGQQTELLDTLSQLGVSPDSVYDNAVNGVAVSLTPSELSVVTSQVSGDIVVPDLPVELMTAQAPAPWNLTMIDSAVRPYDQTFVYPNSAGAGVRVYVIDTGIVSNNPQLAGRVLSGVSFVDGDTSTEDCHGHGTHVAGTIASTSYGVAKAATVVPVRVFNCKGQGGTISKILDGIDWAIANKPVGTVGVINMSLGVQCGAFCGNYPLVTAVQKAVDANFVVVASAGNSGIDACTFAPAAAPGALTVGAIDQFGQESDWSNFGGCVDLYAPGVDVVSLNYANPSDTAAMSGTSMASPHVAGAAALYIAATPGASATSIVQAMKTGASTTGFTHVTTHVGSPNAQLNISNINASATIGVPPAAPTGLVATVAGMTDIDLSWQVASSFVAVSDYLVNYRATGSTSWITSTSTPSTSKRISGLTRGTSYEFRVIAKTDVAGPPSSNVIARTMSGLPTKPATPSAASVQSTSLSLSWPAVSGNGATVSDYQVSYRQLGSATWLTAADPVSNAPASLVTGLSAGKSFEFRVRGKTTVGFGAWSSTLNVSTPSGIPGAVANVNSTSVSPTALSVSWGSAPVNGAPVQDYVVEFKRINDVSWQTWTDGISPLLSTAITGLTPGTAYVVRVSAKSAFGTGASTVAAASITLNGRPLQVASLTAEQTTTSAVLSWAAASPNGSPVTDYVVDFRPATVSAWTRFPDGVSLATTSTVTGLALGVSYYFRVMAVSAYGTGSGLVTSVRMVP
jgi:subtilisin family serine protease